MIKWYIQVMEDGIDTKQVVEMYERAKAEFSEYKREKETELQDLQSQIDKLKQSNFKLSKRLKTVTKQLRTQQEQVVIPLIEECSKREEERQKLIASELELKKNLKILFAVLKSPKMCDLFQKNAKYN